MLSWVCPTLADELHLRIIKTWGSGNGVHSASGECEHFMGPLTVQSLLAISRSPNGGPAFAVVARHIDFRVFFLIQSTAKAQSQLAN
jgi:hypothetical protein